MFDSVVCPSDWFVSVTLRVVGSTADRSDLARCAGLYRKATHLPKKPPPPRSGGSQEEKGLSAMPEYLFPRRVQRVVQAVLAWHHRQECLQAAIDRTQQEMPAAVAVLPLPQPDRQYPASFDA